MISYLQAESIARRIGDNLLFDKISFNINKDDKVALIAVNGAGKSSLLDILAGRENPDEGSLSIKRDLRIAYLQQSPVLNDSNKVIDELFSTGSELVKVIREYEECILKGSPEMLQIMIQKMDDHKAWDYEVAVRQILFKLKLTDLNAFIGTLSGGQKKRVALAKILVEDADLLILDEPTNHLDLDMIEWLEEYLVKSNKTLLMVTHDRYFLDNVAGWILELDRGEGIPWKGNYSSWLEQKAKRLESEEKGNVKRRKILERELEWVRMSPKARHAKSKARLGAYENLLNQDIKQKEDKLEIFIPNGPRLGDKVIEATAVSKSFDEKLLFEDLQFSLPPNGIVGVIGPNGAGKTTLFRMIMGQEQASKGTFKIGETVTLGYVDQAHAAIDPAKTVYEVISGGQNDVMVGNRLVNARAYVARFNFTGADQEKKCGVLSGGERNRLHLALTLKSGANVLLLDEPTNDIDVNTLRALEEGLENFAGCAVIISHDRWFLDRITTHMLAFEGNSKVVWFEGNYSDYEENYRKRVADTTPARIKYKKLA